MNQTDVAAEKAAMKLLPKRESTMLMKCIALASAFILLISAASFSVGVYIAGGMEYQHSLTLSPRQIANELSGPVHALHDGNGNVLATRNLMSTTTADQIVNGVVDLTSLTSVQITNQGNRLSLNVKGALMRNTTTLDVFLEYGYMLRVGGSSQTLVYLGNDVDVLALTDSQFVDLAQHPSRRRLCIAFCATMNNNANFNYNAGGGGGVQGSSNEDYAYGR